MMLRHHLRLAARHLRRHAGYATINVLGLALGIAVCTLVMLYVRHERSYDRFHADADRLYRVWLQEQVGDDPAVPSPSTPIPLAPALEATFPEVDEAVRVYDFADLVGVAPNPRTERIHAVDPAFFEVFSFPLRQGDPSTVLAERYSVVLTPEVAARHFPDRDPMGQTLMIELGGAPQAFTVTGVAEPPPEASSIRFGLVVPFATSAEARFSERARSNWHQIYGETYVRLRPDADGAAFAAKLPGLVERVIDAPLRAGYILGLQPIADIHLDPTVEAGLEPLGDPRYVRLLALIAGFVLLIACINFVTLAVGQASRRAREVGVRKVMGAQRGALMRQFWGEAFLLVGAAIVAGLALAQLALPAFSTLAGRTLHLALDAPTLAFLALVAAVVGLGAGGYPAAVLSAFRPIDVLKDRMTMRGNRRLLWRALVVLQFGLSILLLIGTITVARQLDFLRTTALGFDKEQVVVVRTGVPVEEALPVVERLRTALAGRDDVLGLTASAYALDEGWMEAGYTDPDGLWRSFRMNWGTPEYLEVMDIALVAGRSLSTDRAADAHRIVVNEAFVRAFGWPTPEAALGEALPGNDFLAHEIVGVVSDFHYASLREEVEPLVLALDPQPILEGVSDVMVSASSRPKAAVRIRGADVGGSVRAIEAAWARVAPGLPFDFYFLDEAVDARYRQEERLGRIVGAAAGLAVVIACLGLFGLATLATARRTKEIGVRKVLGAGVPGLVALLCGEFARLVLVAFVLAAPVAYLAVDSWLNDFAYRVPLGAGPFLLAGGLAISVALAAVGYHVVRAALADPVRSLRYE